MNKLVILIVRYNHPGPLTQSRLSVRSWTVCLNARQASFAARSYLKFKLTFTVSNDGATTRTTTTITTEHIPRVVANFRLFPMFAIHLTGDIAFRFGPNWGRNSGFWPHSPSSSSSSLSSLSSISSKFHLNTSKIISPK